MKADPVKAAETKISSPAVSELVQERCGQGPNTPKEDWLHGNYERTHVCTFPSAGDYVAGMEKGEGKAW